LENSHVSGSEPGDEKKQEKEPALLLRRFAHNFPQCGQLRDFERALFHT